MRNALRSGAAAFARVVRAAVVKATDRQLSGNRGRRLLDDEDLVALQDVFSSVVAPSELLGRYRIRQRFRAVQAGRRLTFAEPTPLTFAAGDPPLAPMPPSAALRAFLELEPSIGVDPEAWEKQVGRRAFKLAVTANTELTRRVYRAIREQGLERGEPDTAVSLVQELLDAAGVSPRNPQYAEMAVRTSVHEAYLEGSQRELSDPDVVEFFPVWRYLGIRDGRQGADHEPRFDRYYPSSVPFTEVRGDRPYNCRCAAAPVSNAEWAALQARGARVETSW